MKSAPTDMRISFQQIFPLNETSTESLLRSNKSTEDKLIEEFSQTLFGTISNPHLNILNLTDDYDFAKSCYKKTIGNIDKIISRKVLVILAHQDKPSLFSSLPKELIFAILKLGKFVEFVELGENFKLKILTRSFKQFNVCISHVGYKMKIVLMRRKKEEEKLRKQFKLMVNSPFKF